MRFLATAQARSIRSAIYSIVCVLTTAFCWSLQLRRKRKKLHYWEHLLAPIIKEKVSDRAFLNNCNSSEATKIDLGGLGFFKENNERYKRLHFVSLYSCRTGDWILTLVSQLFSSLYILLLKFRWFSAMCIGTTLPQGKPDVTFLN